MAPDRVQSLPRFSARIRGVLAPGLLLGALAFAACGGNGSFPPNPPGSTTPGPAEPTTPSNLNIVLGRPTDSSIVASVLGDPGTDVYCEYGTDAGTYANPGLRGRDLTPKGLIELPASQKGRTG